MTVRLILNIVSGVAAGVAFVAWWAINPVIHHRNPGERPVDGVARGWTDNDDDLP